MSSGTFVPFREVTDPEPMEEIIGRYKIPKDFKPPPSRQNQPIPCDDRSVVKERIRNAKLPQKAFEEAKKEEEFSENEQWLSNLIKAEMLMCEESAIIGLVGNNGTGKTNLAVIVALQTVENASVLYTNCHFMTSKFNDLQYGDRLETVLEKYTLPELLIVDECDTRLSTPKAEADFNLVMTTRYNFPSKRTILIANADMSNPTKAIEQMRSAFGSKVIDRMNESGQMLKFDWTSFRHEQRKQRTETKA